MRKAYAMPLHAVVFVALSLLMALSQQANAQAEPEVEVPNRPIWEAGLSAAGISSPAYPGAVETVRNGILLPWFVYRGPIFRAEGGTVGARLVKTKAIEFDVGFAAALGASSDDVEARRGMPDLGFQFEFGPRARFNLARPSPDSLIRLDLPLRGVFEINDGIKQRGVSFEPRLSYDERNLAGGFGVTASVSTVFGDRKFNDFLYGVPAEFATTTRPAYRGKAGLIATRLQLSVSHRLGNDVRLFAFARHDLSGNSANRDSPLHLTNGGTSYGLGFVWTIGRSSTMSAD
jgi:MipA family protein